jgi:chromosome segregation ATPase
MVDEIREIESELRKLREDADMQKRRAASLEKEKKTLEGRNEYLLNKLKEASYVYGEAGKRLLYFINNQVNPITERLNKLEGAGKKLTGQDKVLSDSLLATEKTVKEDLTRFDKRMAALSARMDADNARLQRAIKGSTRRSEKGDTDIGDRMTVLEAALEKKMGVLKAATDRRHGARNAALEKRLDAKIEMIKERDIVLGKDIEELFKFGGDIQGLEGKLQATAAQLTQTRIDMETMLQKVKSDMAATKESVRKEMTALSGDIEKKLLSVTSELRQTDEKNLGDLRLAVQKNEEDLKVQLGTMEASMSSFEGAVNAKVRKAEAALGRDLKSFSGGVEKRIGAIEGSIAANAKAQKEFERICAGKFEDMMRSISQTGERLEGADGAAAESLESLREAVRRGEMVLKGHMEKIEKSLGSRMARTVSELEKEHTAVLGKMRDDFVTTIHSVQKKAVLMEKDVENLKKISGGLTDIADEIATRKEETAALAAKLKSISHDIKDKSERDDLELKKQVELMESALKNTLDTAESRIVKENVRSFAAARQSLKKDIHALREENASLKAEVKNLRALASVVSDLQGGVAAIDKKAEETKNSMDQVAASVSSEIEREALKVGKEMAGISAKLKADLKEIVAGEKERFAAQSAGLKAKYDAMEKESGELASRTAANYSQSDTNTKKITNLERSVSRLLKEIVGLKKHYKLEMDKLLKELEG